MHISFVVKYRTRQYTDWKWTMTKESLLAFVALFAFSARQYLTENNLIDINIHVAYTQRFPTVVFTLYAYVNSLFGITQILWNVDFISLHHIQPVFH